MKLIHTADLHIGKVINEFTMIEDQKFILNQILDIINEEKADGIIIAGDIYDRSIPSAEAIIIVDDFFSKLVKRNIKIYAISGNHDSAERVSFASSILEGKGLYIAGSFNGQVKKIETTDEWGPINIYLLPFMKPAVMNYYLEDKDLVTYEDCVKKLITGLDMNITQRNLLVTHYFITNAGKAPEISDSETVISIGGVDNIDASVVEDFDYVALGHIHRSQRIGRDYIRYSGSPIKYSFSEVLHQKAVTIIEFLEKGKIEIKEYKLKPLHEMRKLKGSLIEIMNASNDCSKREKNDYIQVTLTDTNELMDPISTLRSVYPNTMQIIMEKNQESLEVMELMSKEMKKKSTLEIYKHFYEKVTGNEFDHDREQLMRQIIEEVEGGDVG